MTTVRTMAIAKPTATIWTKTDAARLAISAFIAHLARPLFCVQSLHGAHPTSSVIRNKCFNASLRLLSVMIRSVLHFWAVLRFQQPSTRSIDSIGSLSVIHCSTSSESFMLLGVLSHFDYLGSGLISGFSLHNSNRAAPHSWDAEGFSSGA
nr:hypothetical protein Iba_chr10aCG15770 [Ipomoea batatas]